MLKVLQHRCLSKGYGGDGMKCAETGGDGYDRETRAKLLNGYNKTLRQHARYKQ